MKKILILQNKILHYRKSFYNELSNHYQITVLHSGPETVRENDSYNEIIANVYKIGPFYYQSKVLESIKGNYDTIIAMFDVRWISNMLAMRQVSPNKQFIWWGPWFTGRYFADKMKVRIAYKSCKMIFYCNEARDTFINAGVFPEKLFVANNTIHVEKREECYKNPIKDSLVFVGTFDRRKQNELLIDCFKNIATNISDEIKLILIGSGEHRDELNDKVCHNSVLSERVIFPGKIIDPTRLLEYYKKAIASVSFGQAGLSVLQSLGYGVPFITKKDAISGGEITNIKDGITGILCENSTHSLEKALLNVCNNIEFARELGKNAYNYYSENCTIKNMVNGFIKAIEAKR